MKAIVILEYAIYLFALCDIRFEQPFFAHDSFILRVGGILFFVQEFISCVLTSRSNQGEVLVPPVFRYMLLVLLWMSAELFNPGTDLREYITVLGFILTVFLIGVKCARYNAFRELLCIGFLVPNLLLIANNVLNKTNIFRILGEINIAVFFSANYAERIRFNLGFPNPNTLGNLTTCLLCISFPILAIWKSNRGKIIGYILTIALDIFDFILLLECGSRTGMMCFFICAFIFVFLILTDRAVRYSDFGKSIRPITLVFLLVIFLALFSASLINAYIGGRRWSFELLHSLKGFEYIVGQGVFSPGSVIEDYNSHLDNYFIYLLLTTGIFGLAVFLLFFIKIFQGIWLQGDNYTTYGVIACFVADMLYGFGETCIIYPMFPTSAIFIVLFVCYSITGCREGSLEFGGKNSEDLFHYEQHFALSHRRSEDGV